MADPMEALAERMVASDVIGFIGAGSSAGHGYPTWHQLINALYERASQYSDLPPPERDSDMRWLAEVYGAEIHEHGSLQGALREIFSAARGPETVETEDADRKHLLIARLPFTHFITTNYDDLIEDACNRLFEITNGRKPVDGEKCLSRDGRISDSFSDFLGSFSQESQRSVLHLHGTLDGERLTLSLGDYDVQYLHEAMLLRMFSIFATSTVVFIGASLRDADLMELVRRSTFHTGGRQRHYAFLPDDRRAETGMLRHSYGIEPIFYSPEDGHEELGRRLEQLLELVEALQADASDGAGGNARPVEFTYDEGFEDVVGLVKDEIRRVKRGSARLDGLGPVGTSRVLRRVVSDYRSLPVAYRFRHVIWISPGRIGLFPSSMRSRRVVDSIIGEIVYSLGRHRLTGTSNPTNSIRSIRRILNGRRWGDGEPALFVIDDVEALRGEAEDVQAFDSLLSALPHESIAVYQRPPSDVEEANEGSAVDPFLDFKDLAAREWARPKFEEGLTSLLEDADESDSDTALVVLAALCIAATPITASDLSLMVERGVAEVVGALEELGQLRLVEGVVDRTSNAEAGSPHEERTPLSAHDRFRAVGTLSPVRWAVLSDRRFSRIVSEVVSDLLRWSEAIVESFARWEDDDAQLEQLTQHLPNVLTIFEASCWQHSVSDGSGFAQDSIDRYLWLGTDLAYILYNVGRWSEAQQILEYLDALSRSALSADADEPSPVALSVSEPHTFRREVLIYQSRYYGQTGHTHRAFRKSIAMAQEAISDADRCLSDGEPAHEPVGNTYAPNRLTLARQRARARIASGIATTRIGELESAREELSDLLDRREFDGGDPERASQRESLLIVSDASTALSAVRLEQLDARQESVQPKAILEELDLGRSSLEALENRRERGRHARQRGDVLFKLGNVGAARRYYARALLISYEFRDRFLEASAMLGLAQCDRRRSLAETAMRIFEDLDLPEQKDRAEEVSLALRRIDRGAGVLENHPTVLLVVGVPGSGNELVTQTAGSILAEWGYEPSVRRSPQLIDRIRSGEQRDLAIVHSEIIEPMVADSLSAHGHRVEIARIYTGRFGDLVEPWADAEDLLSHILCLHMTAEPEMLRARNAQRRSGQLEVDALEQMLDEVVASKPESRGWSSWETFFQSHGGALVTVAAAGSVIDLEKRVRDALALSYQPVEVLAHLDNWEGSTG